MPRDPQTRISVLADVTNPGHFFACCGLLELAHRKWPGVQGWFKRDTPTFEMVAGGPSERLDDLIESLGMCEISGTGEDNLQIGEPFSLLLNWWQTVEGDKLKPLKTWAGQQKHDKIVLAAQQALRAKSIADTTELLNFSDVLRDPEKLSKKIEPFFFDARRFTNALDAGFSIDTQKLETPAYPAVELLSLIGLQRFRPIPSSTSKWSFEYSTWPVPLDATVAAAVASCVVSIRDTQQYRFSLGFRDSKKRYKSFRFAVQIGETS